MRLTTSPPSHAECHGSLNLLEPSGPHRACIHIYIMLIRKNFFPLRYIPIIIFFAITVRKITVFVIHFYIELIKFLSKSLIEFLVCNNSNCKCYASSVFWSPQVEIVWGRESKEILDFLEVCGTKNILKSWHQS